MTDAPLEDLRPPLQLAHDTWDRARPAARRQLVRDAAQLGYRLVIRGPGDLERAPDPDLGSW